jgi:Flp pilus assembly protein TadG
MRRSVSRLLRSTRGNAAIEFCLVVPPMLLLGAGAVEFGLTFHVYNQTNRLATQYARVWSDCQDQGTSCKTEMDGYATDAAKTNIAPQLATDKITLRMFQVEMATVVPVARYASPAGTALNADEIAAAVKAIPIGQTGIVVTATYAHSLKIFPDIIKTFLSGSKLTPSYTVAQLKT